MCSGRPCAPSCSSCSPMRRNACRSLRPSCRSPHRNAPQPLARASGLRHDAAAADGAAAGLSAHAPSLARLGLPAAATAPAPETGKARGDASVPSAAAAATAGAGEVPGGAAAAPEAAPRQNVTISTDVLRLTFDSQGGTLRHAELLKYADSVHKD